MIRTSCCIQALACVLLGVSSDVPAAEPKAVWEIDFSDPAEPARWQRSPVDRGAAILQWGMTLRSPVAPSKPVFQLEGSRTLEIESFGTIYREFPPDFRPGPEDAIVLDWEWKIGDVEHSDSVGLGLFFGPDSLALPIPFSTYSHSRYTYFWRVHFDPAERWIAHRIRVPNPQWPQEWGALRSPAGLQLQLHDPIRQVVQIAKLRVEIWDPDEAGLPPMHHPHRPPPPPVPFAAKSFESLRFATAGAMEDLDGDGMPELLLIERRGYAHLYLNDGQGNFDREITAPAGLTDSFLPTGALFADVDGDRDLDLAVTAEMDVPRFFENRGLRFVERRVLSDDLLQYWYAAAADDFDCDGDVDFVVVGPHKESCPLVLRNDGSWRLSVVDSSEFGLPAEGAPFSAAWADLGQDCHPELYLGREQLLRNEGGSLRFDPGAWPRETENAEGAVFADLTGDGVLDLLVVRDHAEAGGRSRLLVGSRGGRFSDSPMPLPALAATEVALVEDFDSDGHLDIYFCQRLEPKLLLLNDGSGFHDATEASGFADSGPCDVAIAADVDGDGGLDVLVAGYDSPPRILRNRLARGNWIGVVVEGVRPGTDAVGAEVRALDPGADRPFQVQWARRGRGFGSVGPRELRIGSGPRAVVDLEVRFPRGQVRNLRGVPSGRTILVRESAGTLLGTALRWSAEASFPLARAIERRLKQSQGGLQWAIAILAASVTSAAFGPRHLRVPASLLLASGCAAALMLGATPVWSAATSIRFLWCCGCGAGAVIPLGMRLLRSVHMRLKTSAPASSLPVEDLYRYAQDFRHSGAATTTLLSIHGRVRNLFLPEGLHRPFIAGLCNLAPRYRDDCAPRLRQLLRVSRSAFPDLEHAARLEAAADELGALLDGLSTIDDQEPPLRRWQSAADLALRRLQSALAALLADIDVRSSCDVHEVLQQACSLYADRIAEAGATVEVLGTPASARAVVPAEALLTILGNLFTNALAFLEGRPDRSIRVSVVEEPHVVRMEFADSGPGVPPEMVGSLFDLPAGTRPGGSGYGLARSRQILERFGGAIALAAPVEGQGARFVLALRRLSAVASSDRTRARSGNRAD